MPHSFFFATVLASILPLAAVTVTLAQSDPADIVKQSREAINQGNVGVALALYAPDARIDWGALCEEAPCVTSGTEAIRKQLVRQVAVKQHTTVRTTYVSESVRQDKSTINSVTSLSWMSSDTLKKAGMTVNEVHEWSITEVKDGKITRARMGILDRTEEGSAAFDEWQRTQPLETGNISATMRKSMEEQRKRQQ